MEYKQLTAKDQVLKIYPDAIILKDETQRLRPASVEQENYNQIAICDVPDRLQTYISDMKLTINFAIGLNRRPMALSTWCQSEEECWEDAWKEIQMKMLQMLG
jgi:hypothetical protein